MPSSTLTPTCKFLLDENVRIELFQLLKKRHINVKLAQKGSSDQALADTSKAENRIFVTNDQDFTQYTRNEIYAVVWLKVAQNNKSALLKVFENLLAKEKNFSGKLIILYEGKWDEFPLLEETKV